MNKNKVIDSKSGFEYNSAAGLQFPNKYGYAHSIGSRSRTAVRIFAEATRTRITSYLCGSRRKP